MMTKANIIGLIIGILFFIIGLTTMGNITISIGFIAIGGALVFFSLILQKKYKGSKL